MSTQERILSKRTTSRHETNERAMRGSEQDLRGGFITEYWTSAEVWPKLSRSQQALDCFRRSMQTIISLPFPAIVTILAFALSLFLLSGLYLLLNNVEHVVGSLGGNGVVSIFLKDNATAEDAQSLIAKLKTTEYVSDARYISRADAVEEFRTMLGARASILEGIEAESVLPASIELKVRSDEQSQAALRNEVASLQQSPLVSEVVMAGAWVERLQGGLRFVRVGGFVLLLIVLSVICFLIGNTIRLALFAKREELQVLRLVGAPESFVANPLIVGGVIQGALGAACGISMLWIVWQFMLPTQSNFSIFGVPLGTQSFLSASAITVCMLLGMLVGLIGSAIAIRLTLHDNY